MKKNENENKRMEDGNKGEKCPSKRTSRRNKKIKAHEWLVF
jgi:hypothetical protein